MQFCSCTSNLHKHSATPESRECFTKKCLQKLLFQRLSPLFFLPDMSVFPTVHLRPYTPMDCRTCVGLVSEESRRWYVVGAKLSYQSIGLEYNTSTSERHFCNKIRNIKFFHVSIYKSLCGECGDFEMFTLS